MLSAARRRGLRPRPPARARARNRESGAWRPAGAAPWDGRPVGEPGILPTRGAGPGRSGRKTRTCRGRRVAHSGPTLSPNTDERSPVTTAYSEASHRRAPPRTLLDDPAHRPHRPHGDRHLQHRRVHDAAPLEEPLRAAHLRRAARRRARQDGHRARQRRLSLLGTAVLRSSGGQGHAVRGRGRPGPAPRPERGPGVDPRRGVRGLRPADDPHHCPRSCPACPVRHPAGIRAAVGPSSLERSGRVLLARRRRRSRWWGRGGAAALTPWIALAPTGRAGPPAGTLTCAGRLFLAAKASRRGVGGPGSGFWHAGAVAVQVSVATRAPSPRRGEAGQLTREMGALAVCFVGCASLQATTRHGHDPGSSE
jgi:hypothetical protein